MRGVFISEKNRELSTVSGILGKSYPRCIEWPTESRFQAFGGDASRSLSGIALSVSVRACV